MNPKPKIVYVDSMYDEFLVELGDHRLQFGGRAGDGYCYRHQSFKCSDGLTQEEKDFIAIELGG